MKTNGLRLYGEKVLTVGLSPAIQKIIRRPGYSAEIVPFLVTQPSQRGILFFADYKGEDPHNSFISRWVRPDYVKIDEEELFHSFPELEDRSSEEALLELSAKYNNSFIITREAGTTLFADCEECEELQRHVIKAVSPIGCEDSLMAGLVEGILKEASLKEAVIKDRAYATRNAASYHPGWILEGEKN